MSVDFFVRNSLVFHSPKAPRSPTGSTNDSYSYRTVSGLLYTDSILIKEKVRWIVGLEFVCSSASGYRGVFDRPFSS